MSKRFTILRLDQVIGDKKLEVFKNYGVDAEVTGYAVRRGTESFKLKGKYFAANGVEPEGSLLDKNVCEYWTSTKADGTLGAAYSVGRLDAHKEASWDSENGIRLVVPLSDIQDDIVDSYTISGKDGDINVVTYGEYPQTVITGDEKERITELYENGTMKPTGKTYGAEGFRVERYYDGNDFKYEETEYQEYELDGEKYVLAERAVFDNGDSSRKFWAKVEPIEWLVDEKSGLAVSKKVIVGGIPLKRNGLYTGNINKTRVQNFIDNDLAYDIQPTKKMNLDKNIDNDVDDMFMDEEIEIAETKKRSL